MERRPGRGVQGGPGKDRPGLGPGSAEVRSPPPHRLPAAAPIASATGSGAGQQGRGAARRGQWEAAGGGAPRSAAGRKALEGVGRARGYLKKRVRYIWCAS